MKKNDNTPLWVYLAYSSIETRKSALLLIWASLVFSVYCIPWTNYFVQPEWLGTVFLIDDWSWFVMMVPMTLWYWLSLKWIDKNQGWT